ncbi:MAG: hypothetical protein HGA75_00800 [Thiobacillus sp.]|nr:hypothetical protein [Thiobacillus sp.]
MASKAACSAVLAGLCVAVLGMEGCAGQGVTVLHASSLCLGGDEREVRWLAGPEEFARLWRLGSRQVPTPALPAVDFGRRAVFYLADRERPSGGYGLALAGSGLSVSGAVARLSLVVSAPNGMASQVVTRPCLWLSLPEGGYDRLEVTDQSGNLWGTATRPAGVPAH